MNWTRAATASLWLCFVYAFGVLISGTDFLGVHVGPTVTLSAVVAGAALLRWALAFLARRAPAFGRKMPEVALLSFVCLTTVVALDVAYGIYSSAGAEPALNFQRQSDPEVWTGELLPDRYYPTERYFQIHKPNVSTRHVAYGDLYSPSMQSSRTLLNTVLERHRVTQVIDSNGLRNLEGPEQARVLALGDSFVYGVNTDQSKIWTSVLSRTLGEQIYNAAVSGASPRSEVMMLEYLLRSRPGFEGIRHVLWMLFEGNDLQDEYDTYSPLRRSRTFSFEGTVIAWLLDLPLVMREQSIIYKLRSGRLSLRGFPGASDANHVDGITIGNPLYRSKGLGNKLFSAEYIDFLGQSESYVLSHPHRPRLEETFDALAKLADEFGFRVTVVLAPSAERVYAHAFDGFPHVPETPYFMNDLRRMANRRKFDVIDLLPVLKRHADREMLYWRDDTHLNERGHQIVAAAIADQLGGEVIFTDGFDDDAKTAPSVSAALSGNVNVEGVQGLEAVGFKGRFLRNRSSGKPADATVLTLTGLPPHESLNIRFLLAAIDTWDGSCGDARTRAGGAPDSDHCPDVFNVDVDGVTVFSETLSILSSDAQTYDESIGTLLSRGKDFGFNDMLPRYSEIDLVYDFGVEARLRRIPHTANHVTVAFYASGAGWQGAGDESWGIENLRIEVNRPSLGSEPK